MTLDTFEGNVLYSGCSDGCIRALTLHPNAIIGELSHLDESVEKMQLFDVAVDDKKYRFLLSSTCSDSTICVTDLTKLSLSEIEPTKISKKSKISEVDLEKEQKKSFFSQIE
jgi:WD40 repeat protein